jgi:hypothetical protein
VKVSTRIKGIVSGILFAFNSRVGAIMKYIFLFVIFFIFTSQAFADGKLFPINKIELEKSLIQNEINLIGELKKYRLLFLPGLATDITEHAGVITGGLGLTNSEGFLASFYVQLNWAKSIGLDARMSKINRVGSCDENGKVILQEILNSPKEVIIISQSKAGVDFIHGLMSSLGQSDKIRKKLKLWLAYQPPMAGSPLADLVNSNLALDYPTRLLVELLKGSPLTYKEMSLKFRKNFNYYYEEELKKLTSEINMTTLVTQSGPVDIFDYLENPNRNAFLGPLVNLIETKYHYPNDGIAIVKGTCIDGSKCFYKYNVDHFNAVMDTAPYSGLNISERLQLFKFLLIKSLNL